MEYIETAMQKIVITGASSEIGRAIAQTVCTKDDEVILHAAKNAALCEPLHKELGKNCRVIQADFIQSEQLDLFCAELPHTDILINAAALTITAPLPQLSDSQIEEMILVNNIACAKICRAAIPSMLRKRKGVIINLSSVTAFRGNRGQSVYAGTKGFIESFSRALVAEYGAKGIRVNTVAPGPIEAGSLRETLLYAEKDVKASVASRRLGTVEDVAEAVKFLVDDKASFVNGAVLRVDGGFLHGV